MKRKTNLTLAARASICARDVNSVLSRHNCQLVGNVKVVRASRLRLWLAQWLLQGRLEVAHVVVANEDSAPAKPSR